MTQTDYHSLIDAPTWAFIARCGARYPEDTATPRAADRRRIYAAMCRSFDHGRAPGVTVRDHPVGDVPCRTYSGDWPAVVYLHGGGFVVDGLDSHDEVCAEICAATGPRVVSVDDRLSPEHPHPAAFDDTLAVARAQPDQGPVLLAVDPAGGNPAAAAARALRGRPNLRGVVLIYPSCGGDPDHGSYRTHAHAPMLSRDDVLFYPAIRQDAPGAPSAAPLLAADLTGLSPTVSFSADCDPLADDALHDCARLKAGGTLDHPIPSRNAVSSTAIFAPATWSRARAPRLPAALPPLPPSPTPNGPTETPHERP